MRIYISYSFHLVEGREKGAEANIEREKCSESPACVIAVFIGLMAGTGDRVIPGSE
jgi:hypothetical protein